jgi:hypothetical protein
VDCKEEAKNRMKKQRLYGNRIKMGENSILHPQTINDGCKIP